ncbi:formylglycine-generating enzyme family protein [Lentimicrobium sp.]|uniref:formylglycine-generating enzyme family protein n=1 Tax=Lentimicrobium sp. TaxID=2034841 RepID=UPI00345EEAB0
MKKQVRLIALLIVVAAMSACKTNQVTQKSARKPESDKDLIKTTLVTKDVAKAKTIEADIYMGITEVSQKEFETLMGFNPSEFRGENLPVENVTWFDAAMFCNKLSEKEGLEVYYQFNEVQKTDNTITLASVSENKQTKGYRLPSKEEWCYAAAGGSLSQDNKYSGSNNAGEVAWYKDNSEGETQPVGTKKANETGLYDMSGNVYEWTNSGTGNKVIMGGSWAEKEYNVETKSDNYDKPENHSKYTGFRVVRYAEIIAPDASAPEGIEFKKYRNYREVIKEINLPLAGNGFSLLVFNNYNNCSGDLDEQIENFKVNYVDKQMGGNFFLPLDEKCFKTTVGDKEVYRFELFRKRDSQIERFGYIVPYEGGAVWVFMNFGNSPKIEDRLAAKTTIDKVLDYVVETMKF